MIEILGCVRKKVIVVQNRALMCDFTEGEIKDALFSMHPDKATGADGFGPCFYEKFWGILGKDVIKACLTWI